MSDPVIFRYVPQFFAISDEDLDDNAKQMVVAHPITGRLYRPSIAQMKVLFAKSGVVSDGDTITGDGTSGNPLVATGGGGGGSYTAGDGIDISSSVISAIFPDGFPTYDQRYLQYVEENGIIQPGYVSWEGTGFTFNVTSSIYRIGGVLYSTSPSQFTLSDSDPDNDRYDVIAVDINGNTIVVEGVAEPSAVVPQIDPDTQLYLTTIYVQAASTTPSDVSQNIVYDENTEDYNGTATSGLTINLNNTSNVYRGSKSLDVGSWATKKSITFQLASGTDNLSNYSLINLFLQQKGVPTGKIQVSFLQDGVPVSAIVSLAPIYGYTKSNDTTYQNIVMPLSALSVTADVFNQVRITFTGTGAGIYLDYIQFQGGIINPASTYVKSVQINGTNHIPDFNGKVDLGSIGGETLQQAFDASVIATDDPTINTGSTDNVFTVFNGVDYSSGFGNKLVIAEGSAYLLSSDEDAFAEIGVNPGSCLIQSSATTGKYGGIQVNPGVVILQVNNDAGLAQKSWSINPEDGVGYYNSIGKYFLPKDSPTAEGQVIVFHDEGGDVWSSSFENPSGGGTLQDAFDASIIATDNPQINSGTDAINFNSENGTDAGAFSLAYYGTTLSVSDNVGNQYSAISLYGASINLGHTYNTGADTNAINVSSSSIALNSNFIECQGLESLNYVNDAAAAGGGVRLHCLYHTSGVVKIRLT